MSYKVEMLDRNLVIEQGKGAQAVRILSDLAGVAISEPSLPRLNELLAEFGLEAERGSAWDGCIEIWSLDGYWMHFPEEVFLALAPVMEDGCAVAFIGEDCNVWRYRYGGGEVETQFIDLLGDEGWLA